MFSCITGFYMSSQLVKTYMNIPDTRPNATLGATRRVITYGGHLLTLHPGSPHDRYSSVDGTRVSRELPDWQLVKLVAQCLCEKPDDRPSWEQLQQKITQYLAVYEAGGPTVPVRQQNIAMGPQGFVTGPVFVGPPPVNNPQPPLPFQVGVAHRDAQNTRIDLLTVSCLIISCFVCATRSTCAMIGGRLNCICFGIRC